MLADRGVGDLGWETHSAAGDEDAVREWLSEPMTADTAVRMALLRSPRLQREYAQLGLSRAEVLGALRDANPQVSGSYLAPEEGGGGQVSIGVDIPLAALLALPFRARLAAADYARARQQMAAAVIDVVADVESAWYQAVGERQVAEMRVAVADAAATSAALGQRFYEAGNISELALAREQAAATQARIDAVRADADATSARMELDIRVGLGPTERAWALGDRLPLPVLEEDDVEQLVGLADTNLARQAGRLRIEVLEDARGVERATAWLGRTDVGYAAEREVDGTWLRGPTASVDVPLFGQGQASVARAEALVADARAQLADVELRSDHGVRAGAIRVRLLSEIVRLHREELVPQRETVVARSQQEQGYMLIGVFELIQAKTQEYDAYQGYLESVRDYWVARAELMRAVGARLPSDALVGARTPSPTEMLAPKVPPPMRGSDPGPAEQPGPPADHPDHPEAP